MNRAAGISLLLIWIALSAAPTLAGRPQASDSVRFRIGAVTERVTAGSDSTRHYAVFLPSNFDRDKPSPVVFLMDPRGRALIPMNLFRAEAERLGYVLLSSYETLSDADSAYAVNDRCLTAMLVDAQLRFAADPERLYLAGFSGTAHYSWEVAPQLDGRLAGIFVAGDGLQAADAPIQRTLGMRRPPAIFGTAGLGDFNYDGARGKDLALDATSIPHRFATFDGEHSWPPADIAATALGWFHFRAMRSGALALEMSFVDSLYAADLERAQRLERTGRLADAVRRYREIVTDYDGLADLSPVRRQMATLSVSPVLRRQVAEREQQSRRVSLYKLDVKSVADAYQKAAPLPNHRDTIRRLRINELKEEMSDEANPEVSAAARRMLATAHVRFSFYEARRHMEARDFARAAAVLRLAREIRPHAPLNCLRLARAEAQLGRIEDALEALTCAVNGGIVDTRSLDADRLLDPIRHHTVYEELVQHVESASDHNHRENP